MPREPAKKRYWKTSKVAKQALDRNLAALERSRTHPPEWPEGSYPNTAAEAEREAHPDWPFIEYTQRLNETIGAYKRVENGIARHETRAAKPENSNDAHIERLFTKFPDLLTVPVTVGRIARFQEFLGTQHDLRCKDDETLARAIRRARLKARRSK